MEDPFTGIDWTSPEKFGIRGLGWLNERRERIFDRFASQSETKHPRKTVGSSLPADRAVCRVPWRTVAIVRSLASIRATAK